MTDGLNATQTAEIEAALARGEKIAAVKLYRDFTGAGLKEAKDAIDQWPGSGAGSAGRPLAAAGHLSAAQTAEIEAALARGQRIAAIKLYRDFTGVGLKEAKDVICELADELIRRDPTTYAKLASGRSGCASVLAVGFALAASALAVWMWRSAAVLLLFAALALRSPR